MRDNTKIGSKPQLENYMLRGISMVRIPYDITEISPGVYSWREISVKYVNFNYGGLVNALIELYYNQSEMTAVVNNYLLDQDDENAKSEFAEMQKCRKQAKDFAKWILETYVK